MKVDADVLGGRKVRLRREGSGGPTGVFVDVASTLSIEKGHPVEGVRRF